MTNDQSLWSLGLGLALSKDHFLFSLHYLGMPLSRYFLVMGIFQAQRVVHESTVHLLCSNYWLQPLYQELLYSSSRNNATVTGEKNQKSETISTRFPDWIGGMCYADTLQVWFPAHWAPSVIRQLQRKEDEYRIANPS